MHTKNMDFEAALQNSISYLNSYKALKNITDDTYWPKWNSPWWHMLLLHEIGEVKQIPVNLVEKYVETLNKSLIKIFPIHPEEIPDGFDYRLRPCHCRLGSIYQVLSSWGLNVDSELPWIRPWFLQYQMADGGLNCDSEAYLVKDEVPSSMVGTISAFEAILLHTSRPFTSEEKIFLERGADFLIKRQLINGSQTKYNEEERENAKDWWKLCFPRFYFYDVLRGLNALSIWAEKMQEPLPHVIYDVVSYLEKKFPDREILIERHGFENVTSRVQSSSGKWLKLWKPATRFPLLEKVSKIGDVSPFLTQQLHNVQNRIARFD